jgi:hypothetical protein
MQAGGEIGSRMFAAKSQEFDKKLAKLEAGTKKD